LICLKANIYNGYRNFYQPFCLLRLKFNFFYVFSLIVLLHINTAKAQEKNYTTINYPTADGGIIEADFFAAGKDKAVIFAHGAIFNKESWHFIALKLQKEGITGLAINFRGYGKSKRGSTANRALDILGAVSYLKTKGYKSIDIVGGSMGGAAVVHALNTSYNKIVTKVVLMAPAGGKAITYKSLDKLFIVSANEGLHNRVKKLYNNSAEPKKLSVYKGSYHAQHMFKAKYAPSLIKEIMTFIKS